MIAKRMLAAIALSAVLAVGGCGGPGSTVLGSSSASSSLSAKDAIVLDSSTPISQITRWLAYYSDSNDVMDAFIVVTPELKAEIDTDKTGHVSQEELLVAIKEGICTATVQDKLVIAPGQGNNLATGDFKTVAAQRDYYAANPDDGLQWYGNAARVKSLNDTLIAIGDKDLAQSGSIADLDTMRSYYNNTDKPPFDGSDAAYHQAQLCAIEDLTISAALHLALGLGGSPLDPSDALAALQDLRTYLMSDSVNDGRSLTDHYTELDKVNQDIDTVLGAPDPGPSPPSPASGSAQFKS